MIATTTPIFIALAIGCLVLAFFGWHYQSRNFRSSKKLSMAVAWLVIIVLLAFIMSRAGP